MPDEERRHLNGEIWMAIQELRTEGVATRASVADLRATIEGLRADFRVDQAERKGQAERAPALIRKIEDLWDFRNRLLGALAVATVAIPMLSVLLDRVLPR